MNDKEFEKLIKKDRYQIFVFSSPVTMPLSFARHIWFVAVEKGKPSRWEILFLKEYKTRHWKHLYLNTFSPSKGMRFSVYFNPFNWNSKLIGYIEGKKGSTAHKMNNFLKNSPKKYPFTKKYLLWGPNSNTFAQWVLNHFPEFKVKLPWNSFGKNYRF